MNKKVLDALNRKPTRLVYVNPHTSVFDALKIMSDSNIGAVLVIEDGEYKGIMTERDYARKVILKNKTSSETQVYEIMSHDLPTVNKEDSIDYCMQLMSVNNIRYLPVMEAGQVVGIISINDVIKETIAAQQETISHLTDYIHTGIF